jgi:hypothetical protein
MFTKIVQLRVGLEMSQAESNLTQLDSINLNSARNPTRVRHELIFQFEFNSIQTHERLGSTR